MRYTILIHVTFLPIYKNTKYLRKIIDITKSIFEGRSNAKWFWRSKEKSKEKLDKVGLFQRKTFKITFPKDSPTDSPYPITESTSHLFWRLKKSELNIRI